MKKPDWLEIPDIFYNERFWIIITIIVFFIIVWYIVFTMINEINDEQLCEWCRKHCENITL